jgi:hypothetical protein
MVPAGPGAVPSEEELEVPKSMVGSESGWEMVIRESAVLLPGCAGHPLLDRADRRRHVCRRLEESGIRVVRPEHRPGLRASGFVVARRLEPVVALGRRPFPRLVEQFRDAGPASGRHGAVISPFM